MTVHLVSHGCAALLIVLEWSAASVMAAPPETASEAPDKTLAQAESIDELTQSDEQKVAALYERMGDYAEKYDVRSLEGSMLEEGKATYSAEIVWAVQDFLEGTPPESQGGNFKKILAVCESYGLQKFKNDWPDEAASNEENAAFDRRIFESLGPEKERVAMLSELLKVSDGNILYVSPFEGWVKEVSVKGDFAVVKLTAWEEMREGDDVWIHRFEKTKLGWKWKGYDWDAMEDQNSEPLLTHLGLSGKTMSGEHIDLKDFRGKYVIVDFWGTWCAPCLAELPRLRELHSHLNDKGLVILGVAADSQETLLAFTANNELPWPNIIDDDSAIAERLGITAYPTTLLINPQGEHVAWNLRGRALLDKLGENLDLEPGEMAQLAKHLAGNRNADQPAQKVSPPVLTSDDKASFRAADADKDEKVGYSELRPYLRSRFRDGILPTQAIFDHLDADHDHWVSLSEFAGLDSAIGHFMGADYLDLAGMPDPVDPGVGYVFFQGPKRPVDDRAVYGATFHRSRELTRANRDTPGIDLSSVPTSISDVRPDTDADVPLRKTSVADLARSTIVLAGGHPDFYCMGGVMISSDGLALTNYHVAESLHEYQLVGFTSDGKPHRVLEFLAGDPNRDIALIRLEGDGFHHAKIAVETPEMGEDIVVLHHSENRYFTYDRGYVMRYPQLGKNVWMEVSCDYAPGGSGCGIFNKEHELIGLVSNMAYGDGPSLAAYVENSGEEEPSSSNYHRGADSKEFGTIRVKHAVSLDSIDSLWSAAQD